MPANISQLRMPSCTLPPTVVANSGPYCCDKQWHALVTSLEQSDKS